MIELICALQNGVRERELRQIKIPQSEQPCVSVDPCLLCWPSNGYFGLLHD